MTMPTQAVLEVFLADPHADLYGFEIGAAAGLMSGTVHPILARLEAAGWVASRWEEVDPKVVGRPVRRYYRITETGVEQARTALARVRRPRQLPLAPRPQPGQ